MLPLDYCRYVRDCASHKVADQDDEHIGAYFAQRFPDFASVLWSWVGEHDYLSKVLVRFYTPCDLPPTCPAARVCISLDRWY